MNYSRYGQPQQPQRYAQQPPSYRPQQQQQSNINKPAGPPNYKRQASDLKSMYPITRWCATYIDSKGNASNDWADDNLDVTTPIPSTNVCRIFALYNKRNNTTIKL